MDLDYKFSLIRLLVVMEKMIRTKIDQIIKNDVNLIPPKDEEIEELLKESLSRLFVFHCKDSLQFISTIHSLPYLLRENVDIKIVIIDSISAFFWIDKVDTSDQNGQAFYQRQTVYALRAMMQSFKFAVFVTKQALFSSNNSTSQTLTSPTHLPQKEEVSQISKSLSHKEYLCPTWSNFIKHRFIVSKFEGNKQRCKYIGRCLNSKGKIYFFSILEGIC